MERLTLDEAIAHAKEIAKNKKADSDWEWRHGRLNSDDYIACAEQHEQIAEWLEELKRYKDTNLTPEQMLQIDKAYSEQAKELTELKKQLPPCKVGDTVYWVNNHYRTYGDYKIDEEKVERLIFDGEDWIVNMGGPKDGIFGKTVFLTQEEAEAKLKEMEGE